jgi:hypothetical protein
MTLKARHPRDEPEGDDTPETAKSWHVEGLCARPGGLIRPVLKVEEHDSRGALKDRPGAAFRDVGFRKRASNSRLLPPEQGDFGCRPGSGRSRSPH